jgi:hypothetical protein
MRRATDLSEHLTLPSGTFIEFEARDLARVVELWQATAGTSVLQVEDGAGVVAIFPPFASWEAGPPQDFDLVHPVRAAAHVALKLSAPWRALSISDFLCHVFDTSHSATPEETLGVTVRCIEALSGGLPQRLRATSRAAA